CVSAACGDPCAAAALSSGCGGLSLERGRAGLCHAGGGRRPAALAAHHADPQVADDEDFLEPGGVPCGHRPVLRSREPAIVTRLCARWAAAVPATPSSARRLRQRCP